MSILSTTIIGFPMYKIQGIAELPVNLFFFQTKFLYIILISNFLVSFLIFGLLTKINFDCSMKYNKWEKKNPDARRIFEQSIQEVYDESNFWGWRLIFVIISLIAFTFIFVHSPNYNDLPKSLSLLYLQLFGVVLGLGMIIVNYTIFLGNHRRIYYHKGRFVILDRMTIGIFQPKEIKKTVLEFANMEYKEVPGKKTTRYLLRLGGRLKITIASSTDYDKINALREKIETYLPN